MAGGWEQRQTESNQAIRSHLQQHTGKKNRSGSRRLDVRIRKPGVERKQWNLDGKCQEKGQEQPKLRGTLEHKPAPGESRLNIRIAEREGAGCVTVQKVQRDDGNQHQDGSDHRIKDELHGRVDPPLAAPYADQEIHWNEHHFPEDVKEKEIQRCENADHSRLQEKHENEVLLQAIPDRPRRKNRQRTQKRCQKDEEKTDSI